MDKAAHRCAARAAMQTSVYRHEGCHAWQPDCVGYLTLEVCAMRCACGVAVWCPGADGTLM